MMRGRPQLHGQIVEQVAPARGCALDEVEVLGQERHDPQNSEKVGSPLETFAVEARPATSPSFYLNLDQGGPLPFGDLAPDNSGLSGLGHEGFVRGSSQRPQAGQVGNTFEEIGLTCPVVADEDVDPGIRTPSQFGIGAEISQSDPGQDIVLRSTWYVTRQEPIDTTALRYTRRTWSLDPHRHQEVEKAPVAVVEHARLETVDQPHANLVTGDRTYAIGQISRVEGNQDLVGPGELSRQMLDLGADILASDIDLDSPFADLETNRDVILGHQGHSSEGLEYRFFFHHHLGRITLG